VRRYPALVAVLLAAAAFTAPSAAADSIVYEKDGNVWLAKPDGSGQRQVTTSGGYAKPTQANDGTIVAVKGNLLHRMDREGNLLNLAGDADWGGPLTPAFAPGGAQVAYNYFRTGTSLAPGFHTSISHATRETSHEEIYDIHGWSNPSWIGDGMVLMFDGSPTDTLIKTLGVTATDPWYEDPDLSLVGGEVDAGMTRFAATDSAVIRLYRLNAPPPSMDVTPACDVTGPAGSFFRPSWSPNGAQLAWQEDDGIWVATPNFADCAAATASLVIPGGKAPDWGPADVGAAGGPGPGSGPGTGPGTTPGGSTLKATAPRRIRLAALLRGLTVKVACTCTVNAKLLLAKKTIGKAKKAIDGSAKVKVKPTRAGKARLRRGGKSVSVRVTGGGRSVTKKVKIVR
jgi:hypothetical protein